MLTRLFKSVAVVTTLSLLLQLLVLAGGATPAFAALGGVGPLDPAVGYASWYGDTNGLELELCLDGSGNCIAPVPDLAAAPAVPENYPADGEAFFWDATASINTGATRAVLTLATEATFANDAVVAGEQIAFNRIRYRVIGLNPGEPYTITHPYGVETVVADENGIIFVTDDRGCFALPCAFDTPLPGRIGRWLTWDTFGTAGPGAPPAGYIGDAVTPHRVIGSELVDSGGRPQNYFRVEGLDVGGPGVNVIETDLFTVQGKLNTFRAFASPVGGLYNRAQSVALSSSDPAASIYYTLDGSVPTASSTLYSGPLTIDTTTTIRFVAINSLGAASPVRSETFNIDTTQLTILPDVAPGIYSAGQVVTFTATDPAATIYYTTDGSDPSDGANPDRQLVIGQVTFNLAMNGVTTIRYYGITPGGLVSLGGVKTARYEIRAQQLEVGPINPATGYPLWYRDNFGSGVKLGLCTNSPLCLSPAPNPNAPPAVPGNMGEEAFWWETSALMTTANGGSAQLGMALESTFLNDAIVAGEQINFYRVRIWVDDLVPGEKYTVTFPYGKQTFTVVDGGRRSIRSTVDDGCLLAVPCDFLIPATSPLGPSFLRWDESLPQPPAGWLGNINIPHRVTGSPYGTNIFRIEGKDAGGPGINILETDQFFVQGQIYTPVVYVNKPGGIYIGAQTIQLTTADPEAIIYYTTDGSEPTANSPAHVAPINIPATIGTTTLKYFAVNLDGDISEVTTQTYTINTATPTVSASPAGGVYPASQTLTLAASSPTGAATTIHYTLDGTTPTATSPVYSAPLRISTTGSTTLRFLAIDELGNQSAPHAETYFIANALPQAGPVNASHGFPEWYQDPSGLALDFCLDQNGLCLAAAPDGNQPILFPSNFPDEIFYWNAEALILGNTTLSLGLAREATFLPGPLPAAGEQVVFDRIRIRLTGLEPSATYRVTHPYGVETLVADNVGVVDFTEDVGCGAAPCDFNELFGSRVRPYLIWDPTVAPAAPAGYVGDPTTAHEVVGSPFGTNVFRVEGPNVDGLGGTVAETSLFLVQGKLTSPQPAIVPAPVPVASLATSSLAFGSQQINTTTTQSVVLTNVGDAPLNVGAPSITGANATNFAVASNGCAVAVAPDATCTISVSFTPDTGGLRNAVLSIPSDAASSPESVALSGTGVAPAISLSATSLAFGNQVVGTSSAARSVVVTNSGTGPLTISAITLSGAHYAQTSTCGALPATLAAGATCTVDVTFQPTVFGLLTGSLSITSDAPTSPSVVALSGNGAQLTVTAPTQALVSSGAITSNLIPVTVSWTTNGAATNAAGTPLTFRLERSTNGGTSYTLVAPALTSTSYSTTLAAAANYRYRVQACYGTSCTALATGATFTLAAVQQNGTGTRTRGTWATGNVAGAFGGTVLFATANTASLSYAPARVNTTMRIAWVSTKGPDRGRASVQVDGVTVATIDLYAPTVQPAQLVYVSNALAANTSHTMNIVVLGSRNSSSTGNRVDVDGFVTLR